MGSQAGAVIDGGARHGPQPQVLLQRRFQAGNLRLARSPDQITVCFEGQQLQGNNHIVGRYFSRRKTWMQIVREGLVCLPTQNVQMLSDIQSYLFELHILV